VDLYETKSRISEALVESIFRRARYQLRPYRSTKVSPLRFGREDFSPDFHVKPLDGEEGAEEFLVEVKYRPFVDQFISLENQRGQSSVFMLARRHWPSLYFILVTDHPEPGRSCFQTIGVDPLGAPFTTVDLVDVKELGIFQHNVDDHEELLRRIFGLLATT
jgi:hypothetical protein